METQTQGAPRDGASERLRRSLRAQHPANFALVMATGVISNGLLALGHDGLSGLLLAVNLVVYPWLLAALAIRALCFRAHLWADLTNPRLVFSFFTLVAASNMLGTQLVARGMAGPAIALWLFALVAWIALGYFAFGVMVLNNTAAAADVIFGGWLVAIVGAESLSLLGAELAPSFDAFAALAFFAVYFFWAVGVALYGVFITLFSYRLFFQHVEADDLSPILWVVMGAAAISTVAGCGLVLNPPTAPYLAALLTFVKGVTLFMWAWGSWWIPLLLLLGFWKHVVRKQALAYHPGFWSLVFPLGMYAMATFRFSVVAEFPPLQVIPRFMIWVALAAWGITLCGALRALARNLRSSSY